MSVNGLLEGFSVKSGQQPGKESETHPSNCNAIIYATYTYKDIRSPAGLSYHNEAPTNDMVLPAYIGSLRTLNGNPSTRWSMRIPK